MAIHAALKGQTFITPALASDVLRQVQHGSRDMSDSAPPLPYGSEKSCSCWQKAGLPRKIVVTLAISARIVEFHKYQMMEAHGLHSSAELMHFAIKHGIVTI